MQSIAVYGCNVAYFTVLNLTRFVNLKEFIVGDNSLMYVNEVHLIGLSKLERVVIGENSFTKKWNGYGYDPNRHFYLKNCERVRELKMGRYSFSDYSVIEIENVPSLEVIEGSNNFRYATLELKSDCDELK